MSAVQNDTLKINHCVNRAAPVSIYRDWPASVSERNSHRRSPYTLGHHLPTERNQKRDSEWPSIQIPHLKKSAAMRGQAAKLQAPKTPRTDTRTSSSTHSYYLCLFTLLYLVLCHPFPCKNDVLITSTRIEFSNHENKQSLTQTFYLLLAAALSM